MAAGNRQVSLATEDMFVWRTDEVGLPFLRPNRTELLDLYRIVEYPGVEQVTLSHATIAPALVDPDLIRELSDLLLDKSPFRLRAVSTHPEHRALAPLIGIETGSPRIARKIMAGKALPFDIRDWPDVVLNGLEVLNRNNWFPVCTLIVGSPDETDDDSKATLDLIYEAERRGLHCMWVPSIFTPLVRTRMEHGEGVRETQDLSKLQWQVIMKAWQVASRIGLQSTWGKVSFGVGALITLFAMRRDRVAHEHRHRHRAHPPGTGVIQPPRLDHAVEIHVADDRFARPHLVDADVDDRGAGFHHLTRDQLQVCQPLQTTPPRDGVCGRQVARLVMADRHRGELFSIKCSAIGLPTISEWPTITTSSPRRSARWT